MEEILARLSELFGGIAYAQLARAAVVLLLGYLLAKVVSVGLTRMLRRHAAAQESMLVRRGAFYFIFGLAVVVALGELGFQLGVLLGAAGILTVAIGFASQTSASNLISGLFLIGERSFVVGDFIKLGEINGEVMSIDLLSVKLRTPDNLFVRVPNETLIKTEIINFSRFPIRRVDLRFGVDYRTDLAALKGLLMSLAERNPLCLIDPKPLFIIDGFAESEVTIQFSVWSARENFLELKNTMQIDIKLAFDDNGIEIPYPHRVVIMQERG